MSAFPETGVRAIIFDLGNVLIDFDHGIAARRIMRFTDKSPQEITDLFLNSGITGLFEEGKISPEEFFFKVKEMLSLRLDYPGFLPVWNEIFTFSGKNREVYALAQSLKSRYQLAILTNSNILHFEYVKNNFPIFDAFGHIFTSYELGAAKPNRVIYEKALFLLKVDAQAVFYTDDRQDLVEGAKALGIKASVFVSPDQLREDLRLAGVKVD